jgi:hypothetical protein
VARDFHGDVRSERSGAGFNEPETAIESWERGARADDAQIDGWATHCAKVILCCVHEFAAQASALARRFDTEQSQIAAITAEFDVDAPGKAGGIFREQEFPFLHVSTHAVGIDAVALDEVLFDSKGGVDQVGEWFDIGVLSETNPYAFHSRTRIYSGRHQPISAELIFKQQEKPFDLLQAIAPGSILTRPPRGCALMCLARLTLG